MKTDDQGRAVGSVGAALGNLYVCGSAAQGGGDLASNGAFGMLVGQAIADELVGRGRRGSPLCHPRPPVTLCRPPSPDVYFPAGFTKPLS